MKIGIDARLIYETGVGRYIKNLIRELSLIDKNNQYVVFLNSNAYGAFDLPNDNWTKRRVDIHWHTLREQFVLPLVFTRERLDILHVPYFTIPIFYPGNMVVTMHDVIVNSVRTGKASSLPKPLYSLKRVGYVVMLAVGLKRAKKIIAVSKSTKKAIVRTMNIPKEKIRVTYEGVDAHILKSRSQKTNINDVRSAKPYFLYVGNAYPHKNLAMLLNAFKTYIRSYPKPRVTLLCVGEDLFFYPKLKELAHKLNIKNRVMFFGYANDNQLHTLYKNAELLVFPSLMEGFGLPGLEAMAHNVPVVASDIPVFKEIYGDAVAYFDPRNADSIKDTLHRVSSQKKYKQQLVRKGNKQIQKYSWKIMAKQTLEVYKEAVGSA